MLAQRIPQHLSQGASFAGRLFRVLQDVQPRRRTPAHQVGITAGPALEASRGKACVKSTAVIRAATGAYERGSITWVSPAGARDYGEVHVHAFGSSDLIYPGDKVGW